MYGSQDFQLDYDPDEQGVCIQFCAMEMHILVLSVQLFVPKQYDVTAIVSDGKKNCYACLRFLLWASCDDHLVRFMTILLAI